MKTRFEVVKQGEKPYLKYGMPTGALLFDKLPVKAFQAGDRVRAGGSDLPDFALDSAVVEARRPGGPLVFMGIPRHSSGDWLCARFFREGDWVEISSDTVPSDTWILQVIAR
jgi:hypothetical protein